MSVGRMCYPAPSARLGSFSAGQRTCRVIISRQAQRRSRSRLNLFEGRVCCLFSPRPCDHRWRCCGMAVVTRAERATALRDKLMPLIKAHGSAVFPGCSLIYDPATAVTASYSNGARQMEVSFAGAKVANAHWALDGRVTLRRWSAGDWDSRLSALIDAGMIAPQPFGS